MPEQPHTFDLTPHPRILPMLGQIPLAQWKCLAELIDNCVDSFIEARQLGKAVQDPHIIINTPLNAVSSGQVTVRDNGPGMDPLTLERAAKAGWSGRDPINNLGLFGMGFNIATARLGSKTTVWTTRNGDRDWTGLEIDFDRLTRRSSFLTTALHRPKTNPSDSGTEIVLERLKPEMREWFAKAANRSQVTKNLGRTYTAMLGPAETPIRFRLEFNGTPVRARPHCIWGGPDNSERSVQHPSLGTINAYQDFDFLLPIRNFCMSCWNWLGANETSCAECLEAGNVVERQRRVRGWLGIQRFQSETDFGIDLLRNGRKIETSCKELFTWRNPDSDEEIIEYPIDDQRHRGRIVGEIHLDHCQVPYTKERFLREDRAWSEMVTLVRGAGPLQPRIAEARGMPGNSSPLFKLYQAYRRSSPQGRSGSWAKLLVVKDNARAEEMARKFENGEVEYQTDRKWFELAEEEDNRALGTGSTSGGSATLGGDDLANPEDSVETGMPGETIQESANEVGGSGAAAPNPQEIPPQRTAIFDLTREFRDDLTGQLFNVRAFTSSSRDADLLDQPWSMKKEASGYWLFLVNPDHQVFMSATLTPLDALLYHIAYQATDLEQSQGNRYRLPQILASLRRKFAERFKLDFGDLARKASASLRQIAVSAAERLSQETLANFFDNECTPSMQESIRGAMARRGAPSPQQAINDGRFLQYAPSQVVMDFVLKYPEEFFDGNFWDEPYASLDFGSSSANDEARRRVLAYHAALLADTVWLSQLDGTDLAGSRERLLRASLASDLLAPTTEVR